jgi:HSP20 family protein
MKAENDKKPSEIAKKSPACAHAKVAPLMRFNETDNAFELRLNLPGVEQKGLQVQVEDNKLMIDAARADPDHADLKCVRQEFPVVDYQAAYELPDDVDASAIGAKLANGILTITLAKRKAPEPKRITVSVA